MTRAPHRIPPKDGYRQRPVGNGITWIDERFIQDFDRCNIWLLRGRERDIMVDSGMGVLLSGDIVHDGPLTEAPLTPRQMPTSVRCNAARGCRCGSCTAGISRRSPASG
ncbi:hypothetical protein [Alloyangia pacifica]|uniref:hypothetical protein n=1 Tax=Alloyangia pacifica TaxID=311180 RepID=UPI0020C7C9E5|nr:hypothetical protein [Alloyangia pacifica]